MTGWPGTDAPFRLARVLHYSGVNTNPDTTDPAHDRPGRADLIVIGATTRTVASRSRWARWPTGHARVAAAVLAVNRRAMPETALDESAGAQAISILVDKWFAENTFHADEFADLRQLVEIKQRQGLTISLAMPALNEEETVGKVIRTVKHALMDRAPLSTKSC
jgi:glucosyl-3-phosphoglycerate synthase